MDEKRDLHGAINSARSECCSLSATVRLLLILQPLRLEVLGDWYEIKHLIDCSPQGESGSLIKDVRR